MMHNLTATIQLTILPRYRSKVFVNAVNVCQLSASVFCSNNKEGVAYCFAPKLSFNAPFLLTPVYSIHQL